MNKRFPVVVVVSLLIVVLSVSAVLAASKDTLLPLYPNK